MMEIAARLESAASRLKDPLLRRELLTAGCDLIDSAFSEHRVPAPPQW